MIYNVIIWVKDGTIAMITVENLTKRYGRNLSPALKDISFQIDDGEIVGFAGLNGAGKTTTLRIISGIIVPTSGSVKIDGNDIVREKIAASSNLAIVPELPNFDITQKAIPLLRYYAGFYGMQREEADQQIASSCPENMSAASYSYIPISRNSLTTSQFADQPLLFAFHRSLHSNVIMG